MRVDFYHLTRTPVDQALPAIAERVIALGEKLLVVAQDGGLLSQLDRALWTWKADSFIPHGREGVQPVLLTSDIETADYPNVALVDGVWRREVLGRGRAFHFFDSSTIDDARAAWRSLSSEADVERHYWKQSETGKWVEGP